MIGPDRVGSVIDQPQQVADRAVGFDWMSQWLVGEDFILILPANLLAADEASSFQVLDDSLHGPLGDPDLSSHFSKDLFRLGSEQDQHVGVVGEKRPAMWLFWKRIDSER